MQAEVDARNTQIQQQTAEIQGKEAEINRLQRQLRVIKEQLSYLYYKMIFSNMRIIRVYRTKLLPESGE